MADHIPQIYQFLHVHYRICVVCSFTREKVLHATVQFIRLDPCLSIDCCYTVLFNDPEHFRRDDLVSNPI